MKKIGLFYHCVVCGGDTGVLADWALAIIQEQMGALRQSALSDAADEFHIGVHGDEADGLAVRMLAGEKPRIVLTRGEVDSLKLLQQWLAGHEDWYVLWHHAKGVTHPQDGHSTQWRRNMERACVLNWRQCVLDLDRGWEAVGCHWLTPEQWPGPVTSPFFGGTFWWAKVKYLLELPPLPDSTFQNRFEAESWIGRRRPYPKIKDYRPGWP